jgi:hypothetical protein
MCIELRGVFDEAIHLNYLEKNGLLRRYASRSDKGEVLYSMVAIC